MIRTVGQETQFSRARLFNLLIDRNLRKLKPDEEQELRVNREHFPKSVPWIETAAFFISGILATED